MNIIGKRIQKNKCEGVVVAVDYRQQADNFVLLIVHDDGVLDEIDAEDARVLGPTTLTVDENTSDGYHTFKDLYEHRIRLFIALCRMCASSGGVHREVWRSRLHSDGTSIDGWFIMGIGDRPGEQITYHLPLSMWDDTVFALTMPRAPVFDGHTSADVLERLKRV